MANNYTFFNRSSFFTDVWEVVKLIPAGRATSYGAIAKYLGTGASARMTGWALSAVGPDKDIPVHRVVNRNGMLTGKLHFIHPDEMQQRLEKEGIKVKDDAIVDFDSIFWDPAIELS